MIFNSVYFAIFKRRSFNLSLPRLLNFATYSLIHPLINPLKLNHTFYAPVSIFIWTTSRCNKTCSFCMYDGELNKSDSDETTLADFLQTLKSEPLQKNLHIGFYGGEPFLTRDLFLMIRHAKKIGTITTVTTNGHFLKSRAEELLQDPPDMITVSYYPENHSLLVENLKYVPKKMVRKLNFILSRQTIKQTIMALSLAIENNFDVFGIDPLSDRGRNHADVIFENDPEFQKLKVEILEAAKNSKIQIKWPDTKTSIEPNSTRCFFMWDTMYIKKSGNWAPCSEWRIENYQSSEKYSWNGSWYKKQRDNHFVNGNANPHCQNCIYKHDASMGV